MTAQKKKILFLCTGNSCRSQMAEAWAKNIRSDELDVFSAGIEDHGMNPYVEEVMAEKGISMSTHFSKTLDTLKDEHFDLVITVCDRAAENCPTFPGQTRLVAAPFEDPPKLAQNHSSKEKVLDCYRYVRDQIKDYVEQTPFE